MQRIVKMQRVVMLMLGGVLAGGGALAADAWLNDLVLSRVAAHKLGAHLRGELKQAMQAGGSINAISACHLRAGGVADAVSQATGLNVGRTSLRVRNPANAPDAWEETVLEQFEARKAAGEPVGRLEFYDIVEQNGGKVFRYMKAIPTGGLCTTCHGDSLESELIVELDKRYPYDTARGFREGDIRGAFSISRPL